MKKLILILVLLVPGLCNASEWLISESGDLYNVKRVDLVMINKSPSEGYFVMVDTGHGAENNIYLIQKDEQTAKHIRDYIKGCILGGVRIIHLENEGLSK